VKIKLPRKLHHEIPDIADEGWCAREATDEEDGLAFLSVPHKCFPIPLRLTHLDQLAAWICPWRTAAVLSRRGRKMISKSVLHFF